jgi:hypothetical protein
MEWENRNTLWYEAVNSVLTFLSLREVSQNCFVFDVATLKKRGGLAEYFFGCCQGGKWWTSRSLAAFLML